MDPQIYAIPHLQIAQARPFYALEKQILDQPNAVESWFRSQWRYTISLLSPALLIYAMLALKSAQSIPMYSRRLS